MQAGNVVRTWLAACLAAALLMGCVSRSTQEPRMPDGAAPTASTPDRYSPPPTVVDDFAGLVEQNGAAIVNIGAVPGTHVASLTPLWPPASAEHDPFIQFFRQFSPGQSGGALPGHTLGSGFIISPDGYILTDAQVVAGATQLRVKMTDEREFRAHVVGIDGPSDVALLKIDAHGLPAVRIGKPSNTRTGQWVVSIGSPYGFENTVKAGIVSSKERLLPDETYIPLIQTDLTLNAGDSGGPLFNLNGEVIGIDALVHHTFEGLSFAIPIDAAMRIALQLQLHGKVEHGHLGLTFQELTVPLAHSFGLDRPAGALVSSVDSVGPAARAGLRAGDIILRINDIAITDARRLPMSVAELRPGSRVSIEYWRNHATHSVDAVLGRLHTTLLASGPGDARQTKFGLTVRSLTGEERRKAGVSDGVRVEESEGPSALAGIRRGDIISRVNNTPVSNATQLRQQLDHSGNHFALLGLHNGLPRFVGVEAG
ncbi:trypsin-like peptidase domain-containing protein [Paraburkholderia hospita]|uniref:trypsin-like peptidase domain-containing protein n=1 Tax=Paraburkholderia hospita TaxID=169430 RepID=UPI001F6012DF|nr:trypsin-like peptidase domain-containing protein [Paraburkholderia hospita]